MLFMPSLLVLIGIGYAEPVVQVAACQAPWTSITMEAVRIF
jgi:hypothetical protein